MEVYNTVDSIYNAYVQNDQLTIVTMEPPKYNSSCLSSENLQEFTFAVFDAKIRLPYGKDHKYGLTRLTTGEVDILEMWGGSHVTNLLIKLHMLRFISIINHIQ